MNAKPDSGPVLGFDLHATLSNGLLEKSFSSGRLPAQGELVADDLPRLSGSVLSVDSPILWAFSTPAVPAGSRRRWRLEASVRVSCVCERCLMPVSIGLLAQRGFEFFETASQADAMTEESLADGAKGAEELAEVDYLSSQDGLSLAGLIEDELLLSLPMSPKHADCRAPERGEPRPSAQEAAGSDEPQTRRPLAGLKDLLKKS